MKNDLWFTNDSATVGTPQRGMSFLEVHLQKSQNTKLPSIPAGYLKMELKGERDGGDEHCGFYTSCRGNHM